MGVIYKLSLEIKNYVLELKKANPTLSCRGLSSLVADKFHVTISKSSINEIFKEAGLSSPVGRRRTKRRRSKIVATKPVQEDIRLISGPEPPMLIEKIEIKEQEEIIENPLETKELEAISPLQVFAESPEIAEKAEHLRIGPIEVPEEFELTGAILLKAADYLLGGTHHIVNAIKSRLNLTRLFINEMTESLIYLPLFETPSEPQRENLRGLWSLVGKSFSKEEILTYFIELQSVKTIALDILRIIQTVRQEVRCLKISLSDGNILYLDGQLHTVWSTPYIPYDFSTTIYNAKSYVNRHFFGNSPLILFTTPGYDLPLLEFFDFLYGLEGNKRHISRITFYGNDFEELDNVSFEQGRKYPFIFGLWPWQFVDCRKVINISEFSPYKCQALQKEFYKASIEIELMQPYVNQSVVLKGFALKSSLAEKTRVIILSNFTEELKNPEEILDMYLGRWPNLEEGFQDFSRKIELFTYMGASQRLMSAQAPDLNKEPVADIKTLLGNYLGLLDLYVRWHFLPSGYEDSDLSTAKTQFYCLKAVSKRQDKEMLVTFRSEPGFPQSKELEYLCRRLNEREIFFYGTIRLRFSA